MGLPLYKPRDTDEDESNQMDSRNLKTLDDRFPRRYSSREATLLGRRFQVSSTPSNTSASASTTNLSGISAPFRPRQRRTMLTATARHNLLTSAMMERRHSSRPNHPPATVVENRNEALWRAEQERLNRGVMEAERQNVDPSSRRTTGPASVWPLRNNLEERIEQRLAHKEDLLQQLRATIVLLDQFLLSGAAWGTEVVALPSFILSALPDVIESACSLTVATTSLLSSSDISETSATSEAVIDQLLQRPPYLALNQTIDNSILIAHRRIREQLARFANIGFIRSSSTVQQNNNVNVDSQ